MSGTFMDGGGHDHGGHAMHSPQGGESFINGCSHDHGGQAMHSPQGGESFINGCSHDHGGHAMHSPQGSDSFISGSCHEHHHCHIHGPHATHGTECGTHGGATHGAQHQGGGLLASLLGLNQQQHHNFLAHLLGLDHEAHAGHGCNHAHMPGGIAGSQPVASQSPFWAALQGITLSSLFQGLRLTPGGWMLVLFLGFISWLCAVYWIRRHEPLANTVIGTQLAQPAYERHMPAAPRAPESFGRPADLPDGPTAGGAHAAVSGRSISTIHWSQTAPARIPPSMPSPVGPGATPPTPAQEIPAMHVPVYEPTGPRVKTIVNR